MIRVLVFLAFLTLLAFGASWLAERPGEVAVIWEGYRIETSLVVLLALVVALALTFLLLWAGVRLVFRLPTLVSLASRARRRTWGYAAISRGMVAVGSGDPSAARRFAQDAERWLGSEPLALLLKAQAAQISGDRVRAEAAFQEMLDEPETRVLGLRGLFVEARRKGDEEAARAYARKAADLAPTVGWANEAMLEFQSKEGDWRGALATLEQRLAHRSMDRAQARRLRAVLLTADARERADREPGAALTAAREAAKLTPDLAPAAALAARLLVRQGNLRKAAKVLEASWKAMPHPEIAAAYVDLRHGDSARDRLARAEALARLRPNHPEARLTVAQAALDARQFGRAREALRPLLAERPTVRACLLMAEIEEAEDGATGALREWLARASRAPRDPAWLADGVISDRWEPVSPVTGRLDAFVWAAPNEQIAGPPPDADQTGPAAAEERAVAIPKPAEPAEEAERALPTAVAAEASPATPAAHGPAPLEPRATPAAQPASRGDGEARVVQDFAAPVVFPVPHAPDDPGPEEEPAKASRYTLLS